MTVYIVLEAREEAGDVPSEKLAVWRDVGRGEARSAKAAVREYLKANGSKGGTFVAVPERSFTPIQAKTETQTKLIFS